MFRSVEIALTSLYMAATAILIGAVYYVHQITGVEEWGIIMSVSLVIAFIAGRGLAKVALSPLREHFEHLESLSKETLHELNLPINTITANVAMLRKAHSDEKSLKRLDRIGMAAEMLKQRYDELDYLIKKQMEKEAIERFDLKELLEERLVFLRALYGNVEWNIDLVVFEIELDRIGLGKVIDNIVENGVKYSSGDPVLFIRFDRNRLSICDRGIGMDEIALMRIFDRYYQNDATMAGYGIGLGLVKRYCDRHHIGLHVASKPGEGTCVTLEFTTKKEKKNG